MVPITQELRHIYLGMNFQTIVISSEQRGRRGAFHPLHFTSTPTPQVGFALDEIDHHPIVHTWTPWTYRGFSGTRFKRTLIVAETTWFGGDSLLIRHRDRLGIDLHMDGRG